MAAVLTGNIRGRSKHAVRFDLRQKATRRTINTTNDRAIPAPARTNSESSEAEQAGWFLGGIPLKARHKLRE